MAVLVGISPEFKGKTFAVEGDTVSIGRTTDNDITIDNHSVSSAHGSLTRQGDSYVLKDLGSTNGTVVNGQPVSEVLLKDRDVVFFGAMEFLFAHEVPGDIDAIIDKESAPPVEVASGPATTPISFSSVSPFGTRRQKSRNVWYVAIILVGLLALLGVGALFFFLFFSS
jgi:pSer/pThr/pTyr-binding forkhead associated (FHA) protein